MIFFQLFWETATGRCGSTTKERNGICFEHSYRRLVLFGLQRGICIGALGLEKGSMGYPRLA